MQQELYNIDPREWLSTDDFDNDGWGNSTVERDYPEEPEEITEDDYE